MVRFMTTRPFFGILLVTLAINLLLTWVLIDRKQQVNRVKLESIARSQRDNLHNELLRLVFKIETLSALVVDSHGRIEEFDLSLLPGRAGSRRVRYEGSLYDHRHRQILQRRQGLWFHRPRRRLG